MSLRTKLATFKSLTRQVKNWPTAVAGQLGFKTGTAPLILRNGVTVHYRHETEDWQTIKEILIDSTYAQAFDCLQSRRGPALVLDFGANIGLFGLLAASLNLEAEVHCYEPAKPNLLILETNRRANPDLLGRIRIHPFAVGGSDRVAEFHFDPQVPQMSGFYAKSAQVDRVQVRSFHTLVAEFGRPVSLVKIDVEGAEHEIVKNTPASTWAKVEAVAMEIHPYPYGAESAPELINSMARFGFSAKEAAIGRGNYFFCRPS